MKTKKELNRGFTPFDRKNYQTGFTMIESFVAISILLIAVLGPLTLVSRSVTDGIFTKNQIIASYLAQEGIEQVIQKRNILRKTIIPEEDFSPGSCGDGEITYGAAFEDEGNRCGEDWPTDIWIRGDLNIDETVLRLASCIDNEHGCSLDARTGFVYTCTDERGCPLYSEEPGVNDLGDGFYTHSQDASGPATIFSRKIQIIPLSQNDDAEAVVNSTVYWNNKGIEKEFTISTRLFRRIN